MDEALRIASQRLAQALRSGEVQTRTDWQEAKRDVAHALRMGQPADRDVVVVSARGQ